MAKHKIEAVRVFNGEVTIYRNVPCYGAPYMPRQIWLDRLCELLTDAITRRDVSLVLWAEGFEVDFEDVDFIDTDEDCD